MRAPKSGTDWVIPWHPKQGQVDASLLEGFDAVIHLAGENIAGRWNPAKKARIRISRIASTRFLAETLAGLRHPPTVFACASAIGYYGNRGDELLTEESSNGTGFMAEVCRDWEAATAPAQTAGIRTVNLRFGVVLDPSAGALHEMLLPFRLGLGGRIGSGNQFWSWISLLDTIAAILHTLEHPDLHGPINIVAPHPVRNHEFTAALAAVLHRPAVLPVPAFALRMFLGEMADEALLASVRVEPKKLVESSFEFLHPDLRQVLRELLG